MPSILPISAKALFTKLRVKRQLGQHKGSFGHGCIIGGCSSMPGSVILAAQGAMRAGIGKLSVLMDDAYKGALISKQPEVILADMSHITENKIQVYDAVLLGPGLGKAGFAEMSFESVMTCYKGASILDADALNLLSTRNINYDLLQTIITPHPGEAARLLQTDIATVQADRVKAAQQLLQNYGCAVVVLKGADTLVVGKVDGIERIYQCNLGSSAMSTAGMGDLLSGIMLGLLTQGFCLIEAAQLAVYWHAFVADQVVKERRTISVLASDMLAYLNLYAD